MIVRVFRARIREGRVADFKRMVQEQSIPWLEGSDGMLGFIPGEPLSESSLDEASREFVMITLWRDIEAIRAFAGENWETPVVTEDEAPLVEEMFAHHYVRFDRETAE
jgi:heme-degrading monooxygenase HmoA